jgi:transcriptional regulator with XRE-family HTH domain
MVESTTKLVEWQKACPLRKWLRKQIDPVRKKQRHGAIAELSEAIGVSPTSLGYWMRGKVLPRMESLAKLEAATKITMLAWMKWLQEKPKNEG